MIVLNVLLGYSCFISIISVYQAIIYLNLKVKYKLLKVEWEKNTESNTNLDIIQSKISNYIQHTQYSTNNNESNIQKQIMFINEVLHNLNNNIKDIGDIRREQREQFFHIKESNDQVSNSVKMGFDQFLSNFKSPNIAGIWGELGLQQVVEISGMSRYCDFITQQTSGKYRPDMIVKLPKGGKVIVDSKAPMLSYIKYINAVDDVRRKKALDEHVKSIKSYIVSLSNKKYWNEFQDSLDFVLLYIHGECFLSIALQHDASLIEYAARHNVILTTPLSIITILKSINFIWSNFAPTDKDKEVHNMIKQCINTSQSVASNIDQIISSIDKLKEKCIVNKILIDKNLTPLTVQMNYDNKDNSETNTNDI